MRIGRRKTKEAAERTRLKRRHVAAAALFLLVTLAAVIVLEAYRCAHEFVVTEYAFVTEKLDAPVRIVMVSDLHESEFGRSNERLISAVWENKPDIILCVGDMISHNDTEEQLHVGLDFLSAMTGIAPVYMSLGNHEKTYIDKHGTGILDMYRACGVELLEGSYLDLTVNGQSLRVGGTSEYCFNYGQKWEEYHASDKYGFLTSLCDTEAFSILLCHRPTAYYLKSEAASYEDWPLDLVLCGHTHGGLWQLPFIGSVYLPQQGVFPKYDKGVFDMGNAEMIVGAGLGHEGAFFRLFDPAELVVIELLPPQEGK